MEYSDKIVIPGDIVSTDESFISGQGTYEEKGVIYACLAGVIHVIDKVICVKPLKISFKPDVGDVLVGRVISV